jgi:hypothetical protein
MNTFAVTSEPVSRVTGCGVGDRGSVPGSGRDFSLYYHIRHSSGAHLVFYPMEHQEAIIPCIK